MIVFLRGDIITRTGKRHRNQVKDDVGLIQSDRAFQVRKEGYYEFTFEGGDLDRRQIVNETRLGPAQAWFSPLLGDMELSDFPEGFTFGNGSSGPFTVTVVRGDVTTNIPVVWCVFPNGVTLTDEQKYRMQEIFEGIPPGTPS